MADDNSGQGAMKGQFGGLPLKALIGAPLKATADANAMLARSQTQFILSTCFEPTGENNGNLRPKLLKFKIERTILKADGTPAPQKAEMEISIPLLTIIPMNTLAVDELNVSFEMEVKSSTEYKHEDSSVLKNESQGEVTNPYHSDRFSCEMHGTLASSSKNQSSNSSSGSNTSHARYDITMHAGKLPLPTGITTIIDMFSKSIAPIQLKDDSGKASTEEK